VEFSSLAAIHAEYGPAGVTDLVGSIYGAPGLYTDDTQMTLATARGCIRAVCEFGTAASSHVAALVYQEYVAWLGTQDDPSQRRAPGTSCLSALRSGRTGTTANPINSSKGCGGVMRTAPVGLLFPAGVAFQVGVDCAAITHGHPSGYLPAGFLAELIAALHDGEELYTAIASARSSLVRYPGHEETLAKVEQAVQLAGKPRPDENALLGEAWVGEEALAVSLCYALRYKDDWRAAVLAAVNRDGDSDSTGSITGAILGTALGIKAIPADWRRKVENPALLRQLARELSRLRRGVPNRG
jgi:ADP-ribosylglycohydrolase